MLRFRSPPSTVSHSSLYTDPLTRFPNGTPTERHPSTEPSTSYHLKIHLSLRVPLKGAPPCSLTGSLWTEILRHQSHWSIYSCMSAGVPKKEPSYKTRKNKVAVFGAPRRRKAYIHWGAAWFPRWIVNNCYLYPSAMQPSARYLPPWLG